MNFPYDAYINTIAKAIWEANYSFYLAYAPASLTQFQDINLKYEDMLPGVKEMYVKAAKKAVTEIIPPLIISEAAECPIESHHDNQSESQRD